MATTIGGKTLLLLVIVMASARLQHLLTLR
jgi:hypothetical protein